MLNDNVKSISRLSVEIARCNALHFSNGTDRRTGIPYSVGYPIIKTVVELDGYVAHAMKKLMDAGSYGIYCTEIRTDAVARLKQLGIDLDAFADENRATGKRRNWLRLPQSRQCTYTIISDMTAAS